MILRIIAKQSCRFFFSLYSLIFLDINKCLFSCCYFPGFFSPTISKCYLNFWSLFNKNKEKMWISTICGSISPANGSGKESEKKSKINNCISSVLFETKHTSKQLELWLLFYSPFINVQQHFTQFILFFFGLMVMANE